MFQRWEMRSIQIAPARLDGRNGSREELRIFQVEPHGLVAYPVRVAVENLSSADTRPSPLLEFVTYDATAQRPNDLHQDAGLYLSGMPKLPQALVAQRSLDGRQNGVAVRLWFR
jgi:hypothetical protein